MPSDDLKHYVALNIDFYEILGLTSTSSQKELDRHWRKTALRTHPDKVGNDPSAERLFHLAQLGYDILSDPTKKALYDNARNAQLQKKRQTDLFEGRRKEMKDDLEAKERRVKRGREDEDNDHEKLERMFRQLAQDGKRMRMERQEALKKELEQEEMETQTNVNNPMTSGVSSVPELDRTVKVRWPIKDGGDLVKESDIMTLFSGFGNIESVTMLGPKAQKKKKHLAAVCMVQYSSIVGAHTAVKDFPSQTGKEWERFNLVFWAGNKEPDSISEQRSDSSIPQSSSATSSPSNPARTSQIPASFQEKDSRPATPTPLGTASTIWPMLRKQPSSSSFSSAAFNTPKVSSPFGRGLEANSPSLEELTMIRLKNAEKRRLAEELQQEDDRAAAAEVNNSS
ncbi:MAG: hypothetical protein Q9209_003388 [Squamulea sp. 1 TL-2023]